MLSEAPALTSKAQELASAAAAKKAELTKSWEGLSSGMPRVVEAIKSRVDILSQSKKLPAGMNADTLAQAKAGLSEITQQWRAATEASKSGKLDGCGDQSEQCKGKGCGGVDSSQDAGAGSAQKLTRLKYRLSLYKTYATGRLITTASLPVRRKVRSAAKRSVG